MSAGSISPLTRHTAQGSRSFAPSSCASTSPDAAQQTQAVLAAITDPDDVLTVSVATRHRLEGAALALDAVAAGSVSVGRTD